MIANSVDELFDAMQKCEQAPGLNMLQHGELVHEKYVELMNTGELGWCPIQKPEILKRYHLFHDCGKHLVLEVGEDGKRRFPGHALASAEQFSKLFPGETEIRALIEHDMDFHIMRGGDLHNLLRRPDAFILYATAWAEIKANASMFGGESSESYKIKRSRLLQAGKKLNK